ncbi:MAG TPA: sortase [Candidatus Onthocola stercorigallinarum]|jgi:LPXTG-site transpeptidase (sortase) family protein|nr:sortase [Candidatus Onthocola stercorigallinarum]
MLKKEKNNNKKGKKSQLLIVGSLLILIGISVIGIKIFLDVRADNLEDIALVEFYEEQEKIDNEIPTETEETDNTTEQAKSTNSLDYIAVLKIPSIGLEKGLVAKDSYYNNVNRNIKILDESDMPDQENGNVILAAHSGNGRTAFFKNLDKLQIDDTVSIFYNGYEYKYRMINTYDVEKTGSVEITRNAQKSTLTLITCRHNTNKQIVIICELVEKI